jgi:hypothetical protein
MRAHSIDNGGSSPGISELLLDLRRKHKIAATPPDGARPPMVSAVTSSFSVTVLLPARGTRAEHTATGLQPKPAFDPERTP